MTDKNTPNLNNSHDDETPRPDINEHQKRGFKNKHKSVLSDEELEILKQLFEKLHKRDDRATILALVGDLVNKSDPNHISGVIRNLGKEVLGDRDLHTTFNNVIDTMGTKLRPDLTHGQGKG